MRVGDSIARIALDRGREPATLRRVVLSGTAVDYRLQRVRRRTIGMAVDLEGISVRAPRWIPVAEIEAALVERGAWILKTLAAWRARRRDVLPGEWRSGATLLYRGHDLALALFPSKAASIRADLFHLTVLDPAAADPPSVERLVHQWLRDETLRLFAPLAAQLAARLDRPPPPIRVSRARGEWGSCNQRGVIALNWRLTQLPPPLADYIVAHEVAHLVELNHSPRFWAQVERLVPGHERLRKALREWAGVLA